MSLHCLLRTEKDLEEKQLEEDLKEIIHRRFEDVLNIIHCKKPNEICDWLIKYDDTHRFSLSLKEPHKIVFAHPDDFWSLWAQIVIEDELAAKYNCDMTDEGFPNQHLKPDFEHHKSFVRYLESTIKHSPLWKQAIIQLEVSRLPDDLKKF